MFESRIVIYAFKENVVVPLQYKTAVLFMVHSDQVNLITIVKDW